MIIRDFILQRKDNVVIDISKIDVNYLQILAGIYMHILIAYKCEPEKASVRKQRKIYRWINKFYKRKIQDFPKKIAKYFETKNDAQDLMFLLKECYEEIKIHGTEIERKFNKATEDVGDDVKDALWKLMQQCCWSSVKCIGEDVEIIVDESPAFCRTILLKDVVGVPDNMDTYMINDAALVLNQEEKRYKLYGEIEDIVEETARPFSIRFSSAEVCIKVYDGTESVAFWDNPWDYLRTMSFVIAEKSTWPGEYCNSAEKELLPLIKEIVALEYWMDMPNAEYVSFAELKKMTKQYGHNKITELLEETEKQKPGSSKYNRNVRRIQHKLCDKKCEPLWRDVFEKLKDSQKEYPNKVEKLCPLELLDETRTSIQKLMEQHGYSGTYPDFVKKGSLRGVKLEASYGMTYFIALEKRVEYRIHCFESLDEAGYLEVQFLSGTAMLKKDEKINDIYSCLFNAKGKRLYHLMHHYVPLSEDLDRKSDDLETSVAIAVKKAECQKLTKAEKKEYYGNTMPGIGMFMSYLIFVGGLFSIFLNLGLMLMAVIMFVITGEYSEIPSVFTDIPWGWFLLFAAVGFGVPMGLIEVFAKRK